VQVNLENVAQLIKYDDLVQLFSTDYFQFLSVALVQITFVDIDQVSSEDAVQLNSEDLFSTCSEDQVQLSLKSCFSSPIIILFSFSRKVSSSSLFKIVFQHN
jgi:hypothetical protein